MHRTARSVLPPVCDIEHHADVQDGAAAVLDLARSEGLDCRRVVALRSTNNAVFLLADCSVVAKVHDTHAAAAHELAVGHALAAVGAPIVAPAAGIGDEVRSTTGLHVTFWNDAAHTAVTASSRAVAVALCDLHHHLGGLVDWVADRSLEQHLARARQALQEPTFAPLLDRADRHLLRDALTRAVDDTRRSQPAVIHGSPHRLNIVVMQGAPKFIDLETIQVGPIEWDLAHLEVEVARAYPKPFDHDLLTRCRTAVSATTATWCWGGLERGPDMRAHAEHHLEVVRSAP